ncbi:MAG TPA: hypothetical protein VK791_05685 [bacterium]|jgi:hypothetical protein|nr:hypothetical protein [bacterium]
MNKKRIKPVPSENQSISHFNWLSLWIAVLAVAIPLGLEAMGLLSGPILATACWIVAAIAFSHLIWINPLIKKFLKTKLLLITCVVFGFGFLSYFSFINKPIKDLSDAKPATPQLPVYIPVTTIVKEIINNQSQTIANNSSEGITIWFPNNKPRVEFELSDDPPKIRFWFPIAIRNNCNEKRKIALNLDYRKEQFLPTLWKLHEMMYVSESRDLNGSFKSPEIPIALPTFDPKQEDLFYIVMIFETGESKDGSYYDRLTDLGDQAFFKASVISDKNENSEVQGDFILRETALQTFKEKLPGKMKEWGKP